MERRATTARVLVTLRETEIIDDAIEKRTASEMRGVSTLPRIADMIKKRLRPQARGGWRPNNVIPTVVSLIFFISMLAVMTSEPRRPSRRVTAAMLPVSPRVLHHGFEDDVKVDSAPVDMPQMWKYRSTPDLAWDCLHAVACMNAPPARGSPLPPPCAAGADAWFRLQGGDVIRIPYAVWTGMWGAAWSVLSMRRAAGSCRSSTFPVRAANEQFEASAYMGSEVLQRKHGFTLAPMYAYDGGALAVELGSKALCSISAAMREGGSRRPASAKPVAGSATGTGAALPPSSCTSLAPAGSKERRSERMCRDIGGEGVSSRIVLLLCVDLSLRDLLPSPPLSLLQLCKARYAQHQPAQRAPLLAHHRQTSREKLCVLWLGRCAPPPPPSR